MPANGGYQTPEGYTEKQVFNWLVESLLTCVSYGQDYGVLIGLQNHNEVLKTAQQSEEILKRVGSDWLGLNLDIGSLRTTNDPYEEIARLAPYAYTWQIKEHVYRKGQKEKTDVKKIASILHESGYRGYIPLETLPPADPRETLPRFLDDILTALG